MVRVQRKATEILDLQVKLTLVFSAKLSLNFFSADSVNKLPLDDLLNLSYIVILSTPF